MMFEAIVFLPLLSAVIAGIFNRVLEPRIIEYIASGIMVIVSILAIIGFIRVGIYNQPHSIVLAEWIRSGTFSSQWALHIDTLTAVMLIIVSIISAVVHIYSIGYMHKDPSRPRFFAYLSLFTFAMFVLVTSDNFLQLFFGWEGVGLVSYLLIGFWFQDSAANAASIKAFIVNRVGDFGLILGIAVIYFATGSLSFDKVFATASVLAQGKIEFLGFTLPLLTTICLLLFMGAMGKSAQFLFHTWLPDAMEGPTPVSALIHAATMVTAGVFLIARCSPLFELSSDALVVITVIGAMTAFFAATIALVQNDIKRVIAYSTCSQLGYMFVALGVGAYQVAIFHLFTHAFFKALLFLGAGSVIYAAEHEQDMRQLGGLRKMIPLTWIFMMIGTLALTAAPITSGFYSKDAIIEAAFVAHSPVHMFAFVSLVVTALFTSFYSWRLIFLTFYGKTHLSSDKFNRLHEAPSNMLLSLAILAIGTMGAGFLFQGLFIGGEHAVFWADSIFVNSDNDILYALHNVPHFVKILPLAMSFIGFIGALFFYIKYPKLPNQISKTHDLLYKFLLNKWYFDELYTIIFVRPFKRIGFFFWKIGDQFIIDGFGPDRIASTVKQIANQVIRLQSGYVYHYAFVMLIGLVLFISFIIV